MGTSAAILFITLHNFCACTTSSQKFISQAPYSPSRCPVDRPFRITTSPPSVCSIILENEWNTSGSKPTYPAISCEIHISTTSCSLMGGATLSKIVLSEAVVSVFKLLPVRQCIKETVQRADRPHTNVQIYIYFSFLKKKNHPVLTKLGHIIAADKRLPSTNPFLQCFGCCVWI